MGGSGGETADALLVHLPATGVLFVGDVFMPYLGAPFLPEGSAEDLFETIALIRSLTPRTLVHGHPPLSELFTVEALADFEAALREVYDRTLEGIAAGRTLAEMLQERSFSSAAHLALTFGRQSAGGPRAGVPGRPGGRGETR